MYAEVIIDLENDSLDKVFDYTVPEGINVSVGSRVLCPFGHKSIEGYILNLKETSEIPKEKLKSILRCLDNFVAIKPEFLKLLGFMTEKYHLRKSSVLKLFIPSELRRGTVKEKHVNFAQLNTSENIEEYFNSLSKNAKNAKAAIMFLEDVGEVALSSLNKTFSNTTINKLIKDNIINIKTEKVNRLVSDKIFNLEKVKHTKLQENAINEVSNSLNKNKCFLLHGVTGSGKTEVYMTLIEKALTLGKTAVMLVPEISLTPQMFNSFKQRFGDKVAVLHSGLSSGERYDEWLRLLRGEAKVALGARSAIFSPIENIGIIIIDEEHEKSYISESNPRYDTREVAAHRALLNSCPLVLGSATPSLESYNAAVENRMKLLELPERVNKKELPKIQIVDMVNEIRNGNTGIFSDQLLNDLYNCIKDKKQAMLFINRRGYSSFQRCTECGYVAKCEACDVSLVYHKTENKLSCHYCGKQYKALTKCPECGSQSIRQGAVGTERVVEELKKLYPNVKILRMDNDTTKLKNGHQKVLEEFKNSYPAILVGTQMIAKGHDFSGVTLAGIIDADQSLYNSDYSSSERTYQLITQMSGRAGRSDFEGKVVLQTYVPKHYVYRFAANYDYKGFFNKEINLRTATGFPPYSKIIRILFSGMDENQVKEAIKLCYNSIIRVRDMYKNDFIYLNAMKSPIKRIQNKFRYQILMRFQNNRGESIEREIFKCVTPNSRVSIFVEINPSNLS